MNVVFKVNDEIKNKMIQYYADKKKDKEIPYVVFQAQDEDTVITMYESGKIMFQGVSADVDSTMWLEMDGQSAINQEEEKKKEFKINLKEYLKFQKNYHQQNQRLQL